MLLKFIKHQECVRFTCDFNFGIKLIVALLQVAIIATTLQWWLMGNQLWFIVGVVFALITFVPKFLVRDQQLKIFTSLCITSLIAAHVILGMQLGLYESSISYDKAMHAIGLFAITGLIIAAVSKYCDREQLVLPLSFLSILVLGISVSAGTLWEIFEFAIDLTGLFQAQRGLYDTMLDLLANTAGALTVTGLYAGYVQLNTQDKKLSYE